jgi:Bacterial self-protective colicin-like immunity/Barstar (barnase inhibitor)
VNLEEFLLRAAGRGPCVAVNTTPAAPLVPAPGVELRTMDAGRIVTLDTLFDAFAKAWDFPPQFAQYRNRDAFNDWMRDLDNLTNISLSKPAAAGYLTDLRDAHLFLVEQPKIFSWFANEISLYRDYYRDEADPPAAFGLVLSAPINRIAEVRNRWVGVGIQVAMVSVRRFGRGEADRAKLMAPDDASAPRGAANYKSLIAQFVDRQILAPDFQSRYIKMLKNETEMIGGDAFDILEDLFTSADDYVADPELRSRLLAENLDFHKYGKPLDDEELRAEAGEAYRQLFGE